MHGARVVARGQSMRMMAFLPPSRCISTPPIPASTHLPPTFQVRQHSPDSTYEGFQKAMSEDPDGATALAYRWVPGWGHCPGVQVGTRTGPLPWRTGGYPDGATALAYRWVPGRASCFTSL